MSASSQMQTQLTDQHYVTGFRNYSFCNAQTSTLVSLHPASIRTTMAAPSRNEVSAKVKVFRSCEKSTTNETV